MQHPDYKAKVDEAFAIEHPNPDKKNRMALRCAVAQKLLSGKSEAVKEKIRTELAEEKQIFLEEHNAALGGLPSSNGEDQEL